MQVLAISRSSFHPIRQIVVSVAKEGKEACLDLTIRLHARYKMHQTELVTHGIEKTIKSSKISIIFVCPYLRDDVTQSHVTYSSAVTSSMVYHR